MASKKLPKPVEAWAAYTDDGMPWHISMDGYSRAEVEAFRAEVGQR